MIDQTQMTVQLKREGEYTAIQFLDAKDELVLYMSLGRETMVDFLESFLKAEKEDRDETIVYDFTKDTKNWFNVKF